MYTGPLYSAAANIIFLVSVASAGDNTTIPGILLIKEISSTDWWDPPSSPTEIPACVGAIFTFNFG